MNCIQDGYVQTTTDTKSCDSAVENLVSNIQEALDKHKPFDEIKMLEKLCTIAFEQAKSLQNDPHAFGSYCREVRDLLGTKRMLLQK